MALLGRLLRIDLLSIRFVSPGFKIYGTSRRKMNVRIVSRISEISRSARNRECRIRVGVSQENKLNIFAPRPRKDLENRRCKVITASTIAVEKLDSTYMVFVKFADTKFHHEVISRCQALLVKAAVAPLFVRRYEHDSEAGCTTTRINLIRSTFIAKPSSTRVFVFYLKACFFRDGFSLSRVFIFQQRYFLLSRYSGWNFAENRLFVRRNSILRLGRALLSFVCTMPSRRVSEYKVRSLVREFTCLRCNLGRKSKAKFEDP